MQAVEHVIDNGAYILGPSVQQFEEHFAQRMKAPFAIGVNSGTDALLLTLHGLGIQPEDEVIVPVFGFVASADVVARLGAQIVFVDVNEDYTIDPEAVKAAITDRTQVVMAVHLFGRAAPVLQLQQICTEYGVHLVEDVCQATGAEVNGQPLGTFGIAGAFSFYPTKNLGGFGDGGMVVTDNSELASRLRHYRDHGREENGQFTEIGYNSRLDSIQAAMLDVKLGTLDEDNEDRLANATFYYQHLHPDAFGLPPETPEGQHVFNQFTVRHPQRDQLRVFLKDRQIDTACYYPRPLHLEPCLEYLGYEAGHFPVAEQMAREVLQLPIAPGLTRKELEEVAHAMDLFAQTYSTPTVS